MKKLFVLALLAFSGILQAQDRPFSQAEIDRTFKAGEFAKVLMKAAAPEGKTLTGTIMYVIHEKQWVCSMDVKGSEPKVSVTKTDAQSPERACFQAALQLVKQ